MYSNQVQRTAISSFMKYLTRDNISVRCTSRKLFIHFSTNLAVLRNSFLRNHFWKAICFEVGVSDLPITLWQEKIATKTQ